MSAICQTRQSCLSVTRRQISKTVYLSWRQRGGVIKNSANRLKTFTQDTNEATKRALEGSVDDGITVGMILFNESRVSYCQNLLPYTSHFG